MHPLGGQPCPSLARATAAWLGLKRLWRSPQVADAHQAAVIDLGAMGPRQGALDPRIRPRHSTSQPLVVGFDAGPGGAWRDRARPTKGHLGGVVAPALSPKTPAGRAPCRGAARAQDGPASPPRRSPPSRAPRYRPRHRGPSPPARAPCGGLSHARPANRLPRLGAGGAGTPRTPRAAGAGPPRAGAHLAPRSRGRGPPGPPRRPVSRGGHDRGGTGGPRTRRHASPADALPRPDPRGRRHGRPSAPRREPHHRHGARAPRPYRRGLGQP